MRNRSKKGQSMVEYAIGVGCVSAACMCALSFLGHFSGDIFYTATKPLIYGGSNQKPLEPEVVIQTDAQPWVIK